MPRIPQSSGRLAPILNDTLLICGASARAAAQSARRAGFSPWTADLFADEDLREICPATRVAEYPAGLVAAVRSGPPGDYLYTGALENHPDAITQMSASRRLLGNPPDVLARVRNPLIVADALRAKGILTPDVSCDGHSVPRNGSWLRKAIRSAGGTHIEPLTGEPGGDSFRGEVYFQERIAGDPCSAVFVAARGRAVLVGVTRQLIGREFGAPGEFQYAGSLGPMALTDRLFHAWNTIGSSLAEAFSLQGLFGVDAILSSGDRRAEPQIYPIEVNPRYTASVEILERAYGVPSLRWHVDACREGVLPSATPAPEPSAQFAKLVLYARRDSAVPPAFVERARQLNAGQTWPRIADIPAAESELRMGKPVATIFESGATSAEVLLRLEARRVSEEA